MKHVAREFNAPKKGWSLPFKAVPQTLRNPRMWDASNPSRGNNIIKVVFAHSRLSIGTPLLDSFVLGDQNMVIRSLYIHRKPPKPETATQPVNHIYKSTPRTGLNTTSRSLWVVQIFSQLAPKKLTILYIQTVIRLLTTTCSGQHRGDTNAHNL